MANTRFKVDNGLTVTGANALFKESISVDANCYVYGDLLYVSGNFYVGGNLTYTNTSVAGDLVPQSTGIDLGNTTNRFDGFFYDVSISNSLNPASSSVPAGNTTNRWFLYTANVDTQGTLTVTGNVAINTNALVVDAANKRVGIGRTPVNTLDVNGAATVNGALTVNGAINSTGVINATGTAVRFGNAAIYSNTASVGNTVAIIDSYPAATSRAGKLFIYVDAGNTTVHSIEMMLLHEGTNVLVTKYAEVFNSSLGTFDASITGANVNVTFTPAANGTYTVKTIRQQML